MPFYQSSIQRLALGDIILEIPYYFTGFSMKMLLTRFLLTRHFSKAAVVEVY